MKSVARSIAYFVLKIPWIASVIMLAFDIYVSKFDHLATLFLKCIHNTKEAVLLFATVIILVSVALSLKQASLQSS